MNLINLQLELWEKKVHKNHDFIFIVNIEK